MMTVIPDTVLFCFKIYNSVSASSDEFKPTCPSSAITASKAQEVGSLLRVQGN